MEHLCPFCNKTYANKRSLASHKSQFHKTTNKTSSNTSENNIPAYRKKSAEKDHTVVKSLRMKMKLLLNERNLNIPTMK